MQPRDVQVLEHIVDHCAEIEDALVQCGRSFDTFSANPVYQNSVAFSLLQIGELAGKLSDVFREESVAQIPWQQIRGFRNRIVHNYGSVDKQVVWDTAVNDIPLLQSFCENRLACADDK